MKYFIKLFRYKLFKIGSILICSHGMGNGSASILMNEVLKVRFFIINQIYALISLLFLALTRIKMFQRQIYPIGNLWRSWTRARYNRGNQKYRRSPPTRWLPYCWMWRRKKVFIFLYSNCLGYIRSDVLFQNFVLIIYMKFINTSTFHINSWYQHKIPKMIL